MSLIQNKDGMTSEEDYLLCEKTSDIKHEYIDGYVYAMAGASENHNVITRNVLVEMSNQLKNIGSSCKTFASDMKVRVTNKFFYPDVMVVCDKDENDDIYYVNSPRIIVEVLSDSTRKKDTSQKRLLYFNIPSLKEYVLIEQDICQIEVFSRDKHWASDFYYLGEEVTFHSIGVSILVEDIYYQVENQNIFAYLEQK